MYYKKTKRAAARSRRNLIKYILIGAVAAVSVIILFVYPGFLMHESFTAQPTDNLIEQNAKEVNGNILYMKDFSLFCDSAEGESLWELPLDGTFNKFAVSPAAICTYNENTAQFFTADKQQLFNISLEASIEEVVCGKTSAAVLAKTTYEDGSFNYNVYLYSLTGTNTGMIDMASRQVIDFGIAGDTDTIWIQSLDTTGAAAVSYITTYKADSTMTGSIAVDNQLIENVFITDSTIYSSGTNSLDTYSFFGESLNGTLIYGWKPYDVAISGSDINILYVPRNEESEYITCGKIMKTDLTSTTIYYPNEIFYVCANMSNSYAFSPYNIYIYNDNGELINTMEWDKPITGAKKLNNDYALIWDANGSHIFALS